MPVQPWKAQDSTASTKPLCAVGSRFCRGHPFFVRAAVCSIQNQTASPPELGFDRLRCAVLSCGVLVEVRKQGVAGLIFRGASEARAKGAAAYSAEVAEGSPAQAAGELG